MPSPFTRRGATTNRILKPDVVESGGNCFIGEDGVVTTQDLAITSLSSNYPQEILRSDRGTSAAAPLVARVAAKILDEYGGDLSANLVRALIINSCRELGYKRNESIFGIEKKKLYGFGQPSEKRVLNSSPSRVTLYCENNISMNEEHYIYFYIPKELKMPKAHQCLIMTLVYNPPVDRAYLERGDSNYGGYTRVVLKPFLKKGIKNGNYSDISSTKDMLNGMSNWTDDCRYSTIKNAVFDWERNGFGEWWKIKIKPERHNIRVNFKQRYALVITIETNDESINIYDKIVEKMDIQVEEMEREMIKV